VGFSPEIIMTMKIRLNGVLFLSVKMKRKKNIKEKPRNNNNLKEMTIKIMN